MMGDSMKPKQKRPGEKRPGKYHYNPGNMSEKTIDIVKDEADQENNVDRIRSRKNIRERQKIPQAGRSLPRSPLASPRSSAQIRAPSLEGPTQRVIAHNVPITSSQRALRVIEGGPQSD
jgi:hypothetical protein